MSKHTWREFERADMYMAAARAEEMEYRAEQIAHEAQQRLARAEHIVDGLGEVKGEIVRCRDCKRFNNQEPKGDIGTCDLGLEDTDLVSIVEPDGFCAWGERREK